jgi:hypothetical protein
MMKTSRFIVAGAAIALLPISAALAQSSPTPEQADKAGQSAPAQQGQGATFESLDKNSDGRISKDEAAANENVQANFSHYDVNGDGFIERAEVSAANKTPPTQP